MLRVMRQIPDPVRRYGVELRTINSGGESVGKELHEWGNESCVPINEMFGQTECNLVLVRTAASCRSSPDRSDVPSPAMSPRSSTTPGKPAAGTIGNLAFRSPDPVMMLEYWQNPEATRDKYADGWLITGDLGSCDEDGYFWFHGRADDVITSAGYRIGPSEIEDALARHPAVVMAAAVGVPDPVRTESIKAFVVLREASPRATSWSRKSATSSAITWPGMKCRATSNSSPRCR